MSEFALLALSVFLVYEVGRASLPDRTPGLVHALWLAVVAYLMHRFVPVEILFALAAASCAAIIDRLVVGRTTTFARLK